MKKTPFKSILKKYAPTFAGAAIIIGGITSAALTEIPSSLPASVSDGDIIEASHISDVFSAIRILDDRTDGDTPVDGVDLANKDYVDNEITTATSDLASTSYVDTQVSNAGGETVYHTFSCSGSNSNTYYFEGGTPDSFILYGGYNGSSNTGSLLVQKLGSLMISSDSNNGSDSYRTSFPAYYLVGSKLIIYEDRIVANCSQSNDFLSIHVSYK